MVTLIWVSRGTHHPLPRRDRHRRWSHHTHRGQDQQECLSQALFWPQETFCTLPWSKTRRPGTTSYQKWKEKKNKNLEKQALGAIKTSWEGLPPTYLPQGVVRPSFLNTHLPQLSSHCPSALHKISHRGRKGPRTFVSAQRGVRTAMCRWLVPHSV